MRVGITGASGLIGSALATSLQSDGHAVVRFVRKPSAGPDQISWTPGSPLPPDRLDGLDAVVHLAGAGVGDKRWTDAYKREIRDSRVLGTTTIAEAMAAAHNGPKILISGSAIGYYGDTGDHPTDETGPQGAGFLAGVVADWEAAAQPAIEAGVRTAFSRTGLVVSSKGGAWKRLFPIFKSGLGGKLGSGDQYWSAISLHDEVKALRFLLDNPISGPVNLVGPTAVTNAEVTRAMGEALGRPTLLPVPAFALRAALGEFAEDTLASQRIVPAVLEAHNFAWDQPSILSMIEAEKS